MLVAEHPRTDPDEPNSSIRFLPWVCDGELPCALSAWVTRARVWVRSVLCCSAFPLVPALGSTTFAAGFPALLGGFAATMAESDLPDRASAATAPRLPAADHPTRGACGQPGDLPVPVQRACAHARFSDHAGPSKRSATQTASAPGTGFLSRLNGWPARPPADASPTPSRTPRTARGRCGSPLLHRGGLAPPAPRRSPGTPV